MKIIESRVNKSEKPIPKLPAIAKWGLLHVIVYSISDNVFTTIILSSGVAKKLIRKDLEFLETTLILENEYPVVGPFKDWDRDAVAKNNVVYAFQSRNKTEHFPGIWPGNLRDKLRDALYSDDEVENIIKWALDTKFITYNEHHKVELNEKQTSNS